MSLRATQWALYEAPTDLDLVEFRLLMGIADNVDSQGRGFGKSVATIQDEIFHGHVSERTIRSRMRRLRERGILVLGDQRLVAYLPGNRRPTVYDLNMGGGSGSFACESGSNELGPVSENRGAGYAPQKITVPDPVESTPVVKDVTAGPIVDEPESKPVEKSSPVIVETEPQPIVHSDDQHGDDDVVAWIDETMPEPDENPVPEPAKQACDRGAAGVQQGCNRGARMFADKTIKNIKTIKTRESRTRARKTSTTTINQTDYDGSADPQAIALADRLGLVGLDRIWADFVDWQQANDRRSADWAASFRRWLRKETQYAPKTASLTAEPGLQASQSPLEYERGLQAPSRPHRHTWACEHVNQLLDRSATDTQPDRTACRLASLLNQGSEPHDALATLASEPEPSTTRKDAR